MSFCGFWESPLPQARNPVLKIQSWRDTGALKLHAGAKRTLGNDKTCR